MSYLIRIPLLSCFLIFLVGVAGCGTETTVPGSSAGNEALNEKSEVIGTVGTGTGISAVSSPSTASSKVPLPLFQKGLPGDTLLAAATVRIIALDGSLKGIGFTDGRGNFRIPVDSGSNYFIRVESGNIVLKSTLSALEAGSTTGQIVNSRTTAVVAIMEAALGVQLALVGADASDVASQIDSEKALALDNPKLNDVALVVQSDILANGDLQATGGSAGAESLTVETAARNAFRDEIAPTAISGAPQGGATGVPVNTAIQVTFSEDMLDGNLTPLTFFLKKGTQILPSGVSYDPATLIATLRPNEQLATETPYTATVTTGATDKAGNPLSAPFVFSFTTGTAGDTRPPTISLPTSPPDNAFNVLIGTSIQVTFSEDMNGSTLTPTTFTLTDGIQNIDGSISYDAALRQATFAPSAPLAKGTAGTVHTVTLKTGITDLAGNSMAAPLVFTFRTIADTIPPTAISNSPGDTATDVAVNTAVQVTFSEEMDNTTLTSLTFTLQEGTRAISGAVSYNPATLTATLTPGVQLATNTSYTATVTTGATDKAGNPLSAPFVFNFTTGIAGDTTPPEVSSTTPPNGGSGVAVNASIQVTFSEDMDGNTLTPTTFTLTGGGQNIGGRVEYNAGSRQTTFIPNAPLANNTLHTAILSTEIKDLAGNAMESPSFRFTFTTIPDTTAPSVQSKLPTNGSTNIPVNTTVQVTFSEDMADSTLNTTTFTLVPTGGGLFPGTVSYNVDTFTATFTPTGDLAKTTAYTVTLTTGVTDKAGNPLSAPSVFGFTTGIEGDTTPPSVTFTSPLDNALDVPVNTGIQVNFSEDMNADTLTSTTFTVAAGGENISGSVSYNVTLKEAILTPDTDLGFGTIYIVTVTTGVTDSSGNALSANHQFSFTIVSDTTNPTVSIDSPSDGSSVKGLVNITATATDNDRVTQVEFFDGASSIGIDTTAPYSVSWATTLLGSGLHGLKAVATDPAGNIASSSISVTVDKSAPSVSISSPSGGSFVRGPSVNITATASDDIGVTRVDFEVEGVLKGSDLTTPFTFLLDTTSLTNASHFLTAVAHDAAGNSTTSSKISITVDNSLPSVAISSPLAGSFVKGVVSVSATASDNNGITQVEFFDGTVLIGTATTETGTPPSYSVNWNTNSLTPGSHTLEAVAHDAARNIVSSILSVTVDNTAPTVISSNPLNGATGAGRTSVEVTFSEDMDPTTINASTFTVEGVPGTLSFPSARTATFTSAAPLASNTAFTATVTTGVKDKAGNPIAPVFTFSFKTLVSFSEDIQKGIFSGSCNSAGCHSGSFAPDLASSSALTNIKNVSSVSTICGGSGLKYIDTSTPRNSLLLKKIEDLTPPCGGRMPSSVSFLPDTQIELIKRWISEGANP